MYFIGKNIRIEHFVNIFHTRKLLSTKHSSYQSCLHALEEIRVSFWIACIFVAEEQVIIIIIILISIVVVI